MGATQLPALDALLGTVKIAVAYRATKKILPISRPPTTIFSKLAIIYLLRRWGASQGFPFGTPFHFFAMRLPKISWTLLAVIRHKPISQERSKILWMGK